jgi:hypothetical protein
MQYHKSMQYQNEQYNIDLVQVIYSYQNANMCNLKNPTSN